MFWGCVELLILGDGQDLQGDRCLLLKPKVLADRWGYLDRRN